MANFQIIKQAIEDVITAIPCSPDNIIFPNMAGAKLTKPYWKVQFPSVLGAGEPMATGEQFQRMQMIIDLVVEADSQTDKMNEFITAIIAEFHGGRVIEGASVLAAPEQADLGVKNNAYRVVLTTSFLIAIVQPQS